MMYIIAQILGIIATVILLGYTLVKVDRRKILVFNIIINLLWAVHYLILKAYTGSFCSLFTALMVYISSFKGRNAFFKTLAVPIIFSILYIIIEVLTWAGISTVIQMVGNILLTIAMWSDEEKRIKALFIPVGILWFMYNYIYFSPIGLIGQALAVSFNVFYLIKKQAEPAPKSRA